jgi:hypothetical protein
LQPWWRATFGGEVFWPWFTVIGAAVTLGVAWATRMLWPEREAVKRATLEN